MRALLSLLLLLVGLQASAAAGLSIQGRILRADGTAVEAASVQFRVELRSPGAENCLMFQETHTKDMTASSGLFVLNVGSGSRSAANVDGGYSLTQVFANRGTFNFASAPGACSSGSTYAPAAQDHRRLVYYFNDGTGWETVPAMNISWAPQSIESLQVGGFQASNLLRAVDGSGNPATGLALTSSQITELSALIGGTSSQYLSSSSGTGISSLNGSSQSSQSFATPTLNFATSTAPAWSTNTGTGVHTLNIPMAADAGVTAGLISKSQYDTLNAKLGTSTSFSGDVSGVYNTTSVDKIKGTAVTITTLTSGDYLKYNGTAWVNSALSLNSLLPTQTGQSGKVLTTDGTNTSWATVSGGSGANPSGSANEIQFRSSATAFGSNANFVWDNTNSRVGIGTSTPGATLEVAGQIKITGGTPGTGKVLTSDASGLATWETPSAGGSGDVTGASNIGTAGVGVFKQEASGNLEFKKINAASSAITVTDDTTANELDIGVNVGTGSGTLAAGDDSRITGAMQNSDYSVDLADVDTCTAAQKPSWNTVTDKWECLAIGSLNASAITAGTMAAARLGSGTADATTFLRGDGTWATVSGGSGTPAGSNTQIQFNNSGSFGASTYLAWTGTALTVGNATVTASGVFGSNIATGGLLNLQKSGGVASGATLGTVSFVNSTGTQSASIKAIATEAHSSGAANGTSITFLPAANGNNAPAEAMRIDHDGEVGIGTTSPATKLDVNGDVRAASFVSTSDRRLKTNIKTVEGLEKVLALRGVRFDWISNDKSEVGFIAQEVEEVFPDLVFTDANTGYKSVKYSNIVAPVVEATKELHNMCKATEAKVATLEEKVDSQAREIASLREEKDDLKRRLEAIEKRLSAGEEK